MNEKLQDALISLLERAGKGVDFTVDQMPDVVSQVLTYNLVKSLLLFFVGVLLIACGATVAHMFGRYIKKRFSQTRLDGDDIGMCCFVGSVPAFIGLLFMVENLDWLKIWLAPKVYILDYAASLVK